MPFSFIPLLCSLFLPGLFLVAQSSKPGDLFLNISLGTNFSDQRYVDSLYRAVTPHNEASGFILPMLRVGGEKQVTRRWGVGAEAGYSFSGVSGGNQTFNGQYLGGRHRLRLGGKAIFLLQTTDRVHTWISATAGLRYQDAFEQYRSDVDAFFSGSRSVAPWGRLAIGGRMNLHKNLGLMVEAGLGGAVLTGGLMLRMR